MHDFEGYREMTVEEILSDPTVEAVAVETEEIYLTKYAQMVADSGKHMHMEKPGGLDLAAFERLIDTVKRNNTVFHVGYMYRYNPYIRALIADVKKGELGHIISVEAQMNISHTEAQRKWLKTFPGGSLFFLGCHLIDLILQIKGMPQKVTPLSRTTLPGGEYGEDFGMATLEYPDGVCFAKVNSNEVCGFSRRQLVVAGTEKTVEIKPIEKYDEEGLHACRQVYNKDFSGDYSESPAFGRYDDMLLAFAAMVRDEKENPYTYDYELALYKVVLQCCGIIS